jgi:hypothetical protein
MKDILLQLTQIMFMLAPLAALVGVVLIFKGIGTKDTETKTQND